MPRFKIVENIEDITLGSQWSDCKLSEEDNKIFDVKGGIINDSYEGPKYQIVSKKQRALSPLERSEKVSLGVTITVCTLGLALIHEQAKKLFTKKSKTICFAMLVTEGSQAYLAESNVQRLFQQFGVQALQHAKNTDKETFTALAKLVALQHGEEVSKQIGEGSSINQETLIEIAKLAAQQNGRGTSKYIGNYGIKEEQALIEIGKLAAQQDGRGTSKHIRKYEISNQEALIEIAKLAAQQDGGGTSKYIGNYRIKEEQTLMEIVKVSAVQQDERGTSKCIGVCRIKKEEALIEIARAFAVQQDEGGISEYIKKYKSINQEALVEVAKLAAKQDGAETSLYIQNYGIIEQRALIEVAKLSAQENGGGTSLYIQRYGIIDQEALIEIAKLAAQQDGGGTSEYIWNYGITDQEALIEIAKLAAQENGGGTSEYIWNYGITDQKTLIEIAKLAAQENGGGTSEYIWNYGITDQKTLIEIARFSAQENGWGTSRFIKNYGIKDQEILKELASLSIKTSILNNAVLKFWRFLSNYGLPEKELEEIRLIYICCYTLDVESQSMKKFINNHTQSTKFSSFYVFARRISEIRKQIPKEKDSHKLEKLQKEKERTLLYFSLISGKSKGSNISLTEDQQSYFVKALKHRNRREAGLLTQILAQNFEKPRYFSQYQELINVKEHLILPMIFINQWLIESTNLSNVDQENIKQITSFLKGSKQRSSLRDAKGLLPKLLQALIALSYFPNISSEQKIYLLNQCLQSALPIDKEKRWEKDCKRALDIVNILITINLLEPILDRLKDKYTFKEVVVLFNRELQKLLLLDMFSDHFYEKYLKMEEAARVPLALIKYASNLKNIKELSVSQELQRLATHIIEESVKKERYQIKNNPHLQKIQEDFPEIFQAWQISQEAIESKSEEVKQKPMDFFTFLKRTILIDKHFSQAPLVLKQYLREQSYSLENMKESHKRIMLLCKDLCDQSIDFTKKLAILEELSLLVGRCEFKNDIDSLCLSLKITHQQKTVLIVDSDDWQDLFLSGTEVLGSCQRIDGDPFCNVCLMAYVLDGKNRILCVKDLITGKILARCIFRLLFKDGQPVLFQERIYPAPCKYENLLNKLAETRAKKLELELFTCNARDNLESSAYTLESLGSCSPYEYVDASTGKTKGLFKIYTAKKVNLSSED